MLLFVNIKMCFISPAIEIFFHFLSIGEVIGHAPQSLSHSFWLPDKTWGKTSLSSNTGSLSHPAWIQFVVTEGDAQQQDRRVGADLVLS